jgi:hypothetical protein
MPMSLPEGEPEAGPWRTVPQRELLRLVVGAAGQPQVRPRVIAVEACGASGKSTLAKQLHALVPGSALVHTDDLAWHEPLFGWGHLLADGVLRPLQGGRGVCYRPPQWEVRRRGGRISVPVSSELVIVEGTGASQSEHAHLIDATVWVQADVTEAERRGIARDVAEGVNGDLQQATAFWHDWQRAELGFLAAQQPWRRACVVVNGTPAAAPADDHVVIAAPPA